MEKRALLIEWDKSSGKRTGNINPKEDRNLVCYGWQNMDKNPAIELRLILDNRDMSQYENVDGIIILNGRNEINITIDNNFPSKIFIDDNLMYEEHVKEQISDKKIKIDNLPNDRTERLKELKNKYHIKGIKEVEPQKV